MHLTEWTRLAVHVTWQHAMNAVRPGFQRTLYRIILAMALRSPTKGQYTILTYRTQY